MHAMAGTFLASGPSTIRAHRTGYFEACEAATSGLDDGGRLGFP
jgi:hypothetical protein